MIESLRPFMHPEGVLVVGASSSPEKLGYGVARNLVHSGYAGSIYFVSQKPGRLFDRTVYRSISEIPDPADLAVLVIPAAAVPQAQRAAFALSLSPPPALVKRGLLVPPSSASASKWQRPTACACSDRIALA